MLQPKTIEKPKKRSRLFIRMETNRQAAYVLLTIVGISHVTANMFRDVTCTAVGMTA